MIEWSSLQKVAKGLSLNDLIKDEFKELFDNEFEGKTVEINSIQFSVRDEKITSESKEELISLFHRDFADILLKTVVVDVSSEEDMDHIIKILNQWID